MTSNTTKIAIGLIILIAISAFFLYFLKEPETGEILPADDSTTIEEEPEWEGRLTTVYVYDGDMFFGGNDKKPHNIFFYYFSNIVEGVASAAIDTNEYYFVFDPSLNEFDVFNDNDAFLGRYSFTPGKISSEPISFSEYNIDYYYYVSVDRERMFLLLGTQEFPLQFGKNFRFEGTDSLDSGEIDKPYFYPAIEEFGYTAREKAGTAIFSFDEDEDFEEEARLYIDTQWLLPIEPDSRNSYKWSVVFKHGNKWLGFNLEGEQTMKKNSFGSVITRRQRVFSIKMPDKD